MWQLEQYLERLKALPFGELHVRKMAERFGEICIDPLSVRELATWVPRNYTRRTLFRSDTFEVLLMCWAPGARSSVHAHDGQQCWMQMVEGQLKIDCYTFERPEDFGRVGEDIILHPLGVSTLLQVPMTDVALPEHEVHRVSNPSAQDGAMSIHVYARPIENCLIYDTKSRRAWSQRLSDSTPEASERDDTIPFTEPG